MDDAPPRPNCSTCRHYFVTWEAERPRGCRAYGFKCLAWPSAVVERESGRPCGLFEPREAPRPPATRREDGTWA